MSLSRAVNIAEWRQDQRLRQIDSLSRAGRLSEAIACAYAAAAEGVEHPMILSLIAWDHRQCGRVEEAIAAVRRALELDPGEPSLLLSLGAYLAAAGSPQEALAAFETVLQIVPDQPYALGGKGRALLRLGAYAEAEDLFHRALTLEKDYTDALAGLAGLACQRGDYLQARQLSERILAFEPDNIEAALVLAEVGVAERRHAEAEMRLRPLLARDDIPGLDRATGQVLLGDALHGLGRHCEAFIAYREGNARYRDLHWSRFEAPGVEREVDRAARLSRYFRNADPSLWRASALDGEPDSFSSHLFLIGFPRSGTTLLENVFDAHPGVVALDEIPTVSGAVREYFSDDSGLDRLARAGREELAAHRRAHAEKVRSVRRFNPPQLLLEKLPLFGLYIPLVRKLFPNAKFVFALRDPRDVVLSCFRRRFTINAAMYEFTDLEDTARFYDQVMTLSAVSICLVDPQIRYVRNEDLIADFDGQARRLCDFTGIRWADSMQDFAAVARRKDIRTPSANQVRQGLNAGGVGQWRAYREELEPVMPLLEPWVRRFGYPVD